VKRLRDLEVRLEVEQTSGVLVVEQIPAELESVQRQIEAETQQREREHRLADQIGAIRKEEAEQQRLVEKARANLQIPEEVVLESEAVTASQILDMETSEAPEQTPAIEVNFAIGDSFVITEQEVAEEEIILGNDEFAPIEVTSEHEFVETGVELIAQDAEAVKSISPINKEAGIVAVNADPSPVALAAARLSSDDPSERSGALAELARLDEEESFDLIAKSFDDPSTQVRNAAARALCDLKTDRAASFTRALREAQPDRRRRIGAALAASGLASEAINCLAGESREVTYDAFTILFLMAKAGEVKPLIETIENHADLAVRLAVIKLLAFSNHAEVIAAFRRLAVRGSLPAEVRSAVMEAIHEISTQNRQPAQSAA
jgi:HEAT repeat protein